MCIRDSLIAGIAGIFARKTMWASFEDREFMPRSGNELLHSLQLGCSRLGRVLGKMSDSHNPSRHMLPIVILVIVLAATTLIREGVDGVALQPRVDGLDNPWDLLPLGIIALAMFGLVRTQNRLTGAIMIGIAAVSYTHLTLPTNREV